MPQNPDTPPDATGFNPIALVAAIALPGAGHMVRGEAWRGVYACIGVLGLFFGGILIGGIDVIDSREDRAWFYGQAFVGPIAFGVDYLHQQHFKVHERQNSSRVRSADPNEARGPDGGVSLITPDPATGVPTTTYVRTLPNGKSETVVVSPARPPNIKSLSKVNELGTLFATIAGMLNVIVIVDGGFPTIRRRPAAPGGVA